MFMHAYPDHKSKMIAKNKSIWPAQPGHSWEKVYFHDGPMEIIKTSYRN